MTTRDSAIGPSGNQLRLTNYSAEEGLVCPDCRVPLRQDGETLLCPACHGRWPVLDGVPQFVEDFPYWGEIPLEQMRDVNRQAEAGHWKTALLESLDPAVKRAAGMILNLDRANWQWLMDLPSESRILDLGAGTGTNSHALAMHYREVVAVEPVLERIQFMQHRFAQESLSNIKIVRSSVWTLPFAKESFDLVAMNGVLEWVAEGKSGNPGELQQEALRNVFHLLRPGGYLYLGIENRMCLGYFIGYPDPHCGLPFVTMLPRRLAHWYARRKGQHNGYRNYLYTDSGYRKLLREVGFSSADVYLALPSYNHPRFLLPVKDNIFHYYSRNFTLQQTGLFRKTIHEVLLTAGLLKHSEYSFAVLARK